MGSLLPLCLSIICLFLSTAAATGSSQNNTNATERTTTMPAHSTRSVSINATEAPPLTTSFSPTSKTLKVTPESEDKITTRQHSTKTNKTFKTTRPILTTSGQPSVAPSGSSNGTAVTLVFLILLLLILMVILYRWYQRNPNRRTCRGLWASIVETAQWTWSTVMTLLQSAQKQPEQMEDEDEDEEEVAVVVEMDKQEGDGGQKTERNGKEEGAAKNEDNASSDSDTSSEDYSLVEGANGEEDEKDKDGDAASKKSNKEDTVEMTSVKLDDEEDVENAEPEESDDFTPL